MPDAAYRQLPGLLCGLLLLLPALVQAGEDSLYRVEMLIFSRPGGGSAEVWDATPALAYPTHSRFLVEADHPAVAAQLQEPGTLPGFQEKVAPGSGTPAPFTALPSSNLEFRGAADRMQRDGRYHKLFHKAWIQPIPSRSQAPSLVLDRSGDGGPWPVLQGSVKLYVSRYIYLETNLWLNTNGEYLRSTWRMPPPPLGPPSAMSVDNFAPANLAPPPPPGTQPTAGQGQGAPGLQTAGESTGPAYPYAHAVLLNETRRLRSGAVSYIDHPLFGIVVKVTPMTGAPGSEPG